MKTQKIKNYKKIVINLSLSVVLVIILLFASYVHATDAPYLELSHIANCNNGDTITFNVYIKGNNITSINLNNSSIQLIGFSAEINVRATGSRSYQVTLTNISDENGENRVVIANNVVTANDNRTGAAYSSAVTSNTFNITKTDNVAPVLTIIGPSASTVKNGDTITFIARYTDNFSVNNIILYKNSIKLNGFTANISISGSGANQKVVERKITLSNIQGSNGNKSITICEATASDSSQNRANGATSGIFKINNNAVSNNNNNNVNNENNQNNENKPEDKENNDNEQQDSTKPSDWIPNPKTGIY